MANEPTSAERAVLLSNKGAEFHAKGQVDAARLHYIAGAMLDPENSNVLQNWSGALYALEHFAAAASVGRRAVRLNPKNAFAHANLAISLIALGRCEEASEHMSVAIEIMPGQASFYHGLGQSYYRSNNFEQAVFAFDRSIEFDANINDAHNDRALALLALGRVAEGLRAYEVRWKTLFQSPAWELGIPEWKGEDLGGKHILVHHEQGFGDTIMLSRFLRELQRRAERVTIALPPELMKLVAQNFPRIKIVPWMEPKIQADFHSPLLSVMCWLDIKREDIDPRAYIRAGVMPIQLPKMRRRIGICWASGDHSAKLRHRRRTVPLELFLPVSELPGVQLISLQKGSGTERDIPALGAEGIVFDPMGRCADFADTAAVIGACDLVISVDSAVAHLAGAMGKPVYMLGPFTRCWRWWNETDGAPWYRNFSIHTQDSDGDWRRVMNEVSGAIGVCGGVRAAA